MSKIKQKRTRPVFGVDEWNIRQIRFDNEAFALAETVFSQSNGYQGVRGILEEKRASDVVQSGAIVTGLYELETGIVAYIKGKSVLPDVFLRVANAPHYMRTNLYAEEQEFSFAKCRSHQRYLSLRDGQVACSALWQTQNGRQTEVKIERFISLWEPGRALLRFSVKPLNYTGRIRFESWLEGNVISSYLGSNIWTDIETDFSEPGNICLSALTKHSQLFVRVKACHSLFCRDEQLQIEPVFNDFGESINIQHCLEARQGRTYVLQKSIWLETCEKKQASSPVQPADIGVRSYECAFESSKDRWTEAWRDCDIQIQGDPEAQQGIRFCIYQLIQAYRPGLETSIGSKGLTGEGYGLLCFWDAEIYMLPFYLYTMPSLARQMLAFR